MSLLLRLFFFLLLHTALSPFFLFVFEPAHGEFDSLSTEGNNLYIYIYIYIYIIFVKRRRRMDNAMDFLESHPLVGFQMDGSHLHNVLQGIIREQQQQAHYQRQVIQRMDDMEEELRNLSVRQKEIEKMFGIVGSDTIRRMRQQLGDLDQGMDRLASNMKETRQVVDEAAQVAVDANHGVQKLERELAPLRGRQENMQQYLDDLGSEMAHSNGQLNDALKDIEREQVRLSEKTQDLIREMQQRDGRENWQVLRDMISEFSERTDKNFQSVEESARAVDTELARHRSDIDGVQGDVGSLEDRMRQRISNIVKDVDDKYQLILDLLRDHEKSSLEIEEHMVAAGQVLARRHAGRQSYGASESRGHDQAGSRRARW